MKNMFKIKFTKNSYYKKEKYIRVRKKNKRCQSENSKAEAKIYKKITKKDGKNKHKKVTKIFEKKKKTKMESAEEISSKIYLKKTKIPKRIWRKLL